MGSSTQRMRPRYRLAIFDFDGTLADSFPWFLGIVNRLADDVGFRRIEEHEVDALRGLGARQVMAHLGMPVWKLPRVAQRMREHMARDIGHIRPFPGVGPLLQELAGRGVALSVVTSNSAENVQRVLGPETSALIGHYACGVSLFGKRSKLRGVLAGSGIAAAEAIAIGDEIRDLEAARAEGIAFGAVSWGYTHLQALRAHEPDEVFESVEEIAGRLVSGRPA